MYVQIFSSIGAVEVVEKLITKFDQDKQTERQTRKQVKKNVVITRFRSFNQNNLVTLEFFSYVNV